MAEPTAAEVPATDPYDLGDTDLHLGSGTAALQPDPAPEAEAAPAQPPSSSQPRNSDGTFAPKSEHPDWLVRQAGEFGLDADAVATMTTSALGRVVNQMHRDRQQWRESFAQQRDLDGNSPTIPTTPTAKDEDFDLGFDASQFDPTLINGFKSVLSRQQKKIAELESRLGGVQQSLEQRDNETRSAWVDRLLNEHGNLDRIGKGNVRQIKPNSAELRLRQSVLNHAQVLAGPKASPEEWIPLIPDALKELGLTKSEQPAQQKPTNRITQEQWDAGTLALPTQRNGAAEPNGDVKAVRNLEKKMNAGPGAAEVYATLLK